MILLSLVESLEIHLGHRVERQSERGVRKIAKQFELVGFSIKNSVTKIDQNETPAFRIFGFSVGFKVKELSRFGVIGSVEEPKCVV